MAREADTQNRRKIRRGPSIAEIARVSGVGTATVDRVLNARGQVSLQTRMKVLETLNALQKPSATRVRRVAFVCESGDSFNRSLREAVAAVAWRRQDLALETLTYSSFDVQLVSFSQELERQAGLSDGIVLIAREDPHVLRAARAIVRRGKPLVCLATDLPKSCRSGFVGSDERSAGSAAGGLIGSLIGNRDGRVLFIACGAYHAAKDREDGFCAVLRDAFPTIRIDQRIDVRNDPDIAYGAVKTFIREHGLPDAIYSIAGGNSGVGRALVELGVERRVIFIGHELNANSRALLQSGAMDFLITRDQEQEVMLGLAMIEAILDGRPYHDREARQVRIACRYTCG